MVLYKPQANGYQQVSLASQPMGNQAGQHGGYQSQAPVQPHLVHQLQPLVQQPQPVIQQQENGL
jgi:hypothetical protein